MLNTLVSAKRAAVALTFGLQLAILGVVPVPSEQMAWIAPPLSRRRKDTATSFYDAREAEVMPALSRAIEQSLAAQEAELSALKHDWDGYGADPVDVDLVKSFVSELRLSLVGAQIRPPDIIPGADGSLQAEWHLKGAEIFYQIDADKQRMLYLAVKGTESFCRFGEEASSLFDQIVHAVGNKRSAPAETARPLVSTNG